MLSVETFGRDCNRCLRTVGSFVSTDHRLRFPFFSSFERQKASPVCANPFYVLGSPHGKVVFEIGCTNRRLLDPTLASAFEPNAKRSMKLALSLNEEEVPRLAIVSDTKEHTPFAIPSNPMWNQTSRSARSRQGYALRAGFAALDTPCALREGDLRGSMRR